jgi:archaellum component FlaC
MAEPDNAVLVLLRRLDEKMDRVLDEMHDVKVRLTAMEENMAGAHRRMDRIEQRVERIERRLDLVDTTH